MFLLRPTPMNCAALDVEDLHSNMFLLRRGYGISGGYGISEFTFQYVSIKTKFPADIVLFAS